MRINKSMTFAAAAMLGLLCSQAFAADPVNREATMQSSMEATSTEPATAVVSTMRKVYYFDHLDKNHNGMLSRSEIPRDMSDLRRNFVRVDFDHNGQISPEEYVLYERGLAPQYVGVSHAYVYVYSHNKEQRTQRINTGM